MNEFHRLGAIWSEMLSNAIGKKSFGGTNKRKKGGGNRQDQRVPSACVRCKQRGRA